MSHLGLYYAAKIRGACDLALFDKTGDAKQQTSAVQHLEAALGHWKNYSAAYTRQYVQPVLYNRAGLVDIPKQTENVAADVQDGARLEARHHQRSQDQALRHGGGIQEVIVAMPIKHHKYPRVKEPPDSLGGEGAVAATSPW